MRAAEQHAQMKNNTMSEKLPGVTIPWQRLGFYLALSLVFFLLGFLPMWFKANRAVEQRDAAQREVPLSQLQNTLGTAMVEVQRGEFEPARQRTSDFYTHLRRQIDAGSQSVFTPTQRERLLPLLEERDDLITSLARSDPAAEDRLFEVYSSYNKLTSNGSREEGIRI